MGEISHWWKICNNKEMTEEIIKQVIANSGRFPTLPQNLDESDFHATKFCQRIVSLHTKVLFLIQYLGQPICLAKTVRDVKYNNKLRFEKENQSNARQTGILKVPEVFFESEIQGRYIYFEEVVLGDMISSRSILKNERDIIKSIAEFPIKKEIDSRNLYNRLNGYLPPHHPLYSLMSPISKYNGTIKIGITHNDFARQNLVQSKGGIYLIDWERSGECPLWLVDAVSFVVKIKKIKNLEDWMSRGAPLLVSYAQVGLEYVTVIYCIMSIMNYERNKNTTRYDDLVNIMKF